MKYIPSIDKFVGKWGPHFNGKFTIRLLPLFINFLTNSNNQQTAIDIQLAKTFEHIIYELAGNQIYPFFKDIMVLWKELCLLTPISRLNNPDSRIFTGFESGSELAYTSDSFLGPT